MANVFSDNKKSNSFHCITRVWFTRMNSWHQHYYFSFIFNTLLFNFFLLWIIFFYILSNSCTKNIISFNINIIKTNLTNNSQNISCPKLKIKKEIVPDLKNNYLNFKFIITHRCAKMIPSNYNRGKFILI